MAETVPNELDLQAIKPKPYAFCSSGRERGSKLAFATSLKQKSMSDATGRDCTDASSCHFGGDSQSPPISEISTLKSDDSDTDGRRFSPSEVNYGDSPGSKPGSANLSYESPCTAASCDGVFSSTAPSSDNVWSLVVREVPAFVGGGDKPRKIEDSSFNHLQARNPSDLEFGYGNAKVKSELKQDASCSEGIAFTGSGLRVENGQNVLQWPDSALDFTLDSLDGEVHNMELFEDEEVLLASITMGSDTISGREATNPGSEEDSLTGGSCRQSQEGESAHSKRTKNSSARKKVKVDWTPDLHRRFVQAVEQLGVEKAIPSRILELMGVQCLTRHNIASHLQKYRSHRRHMMAREAETNSWGSRKISDPSSWPRLRRDGTAIVNTTQPHIQPRPATSYTPIQPQPQSQSQPQPQLAPQQQMRSQAQIQHQLQAQVHPQLGLPVSPSLSHTTVVHSQHPAAAAAAAGPPVVTLSAPHVAAVPSSMMHPGHALGLPLYVWGHPTVDHSPNHMWQQPPMSGSSLPPWCSTDGPALWQYPTGSVDPWSQTLPPVQGTPFYSQPLMRVGSSAVVCGTPAAAAAVAAPPQEPTALPPVMHGYSIPEQISVPAYTSPEPEAMIRSPALSVDSSSDQSIKCQLEAAINEAMSNPWSLPLGLNPPSVDRIIADLQKQGITDSSIMAS